MSSRELDQFFTKPSVAKACVDSIPNKYKSDNYVWMEPAAGACAFYNEFPVADKIAMDLDPKSSVVKQQDFLQYTHSGSKPVVVVTNPPFGKVFKLAVEFFNQSAQFADVICMLIPTSFEGYAIHRRLNPDFKLVSSEWVREDAFTLDGEDYPLRTCFQVWARDSDIDLRLSDFEPKITHPDFTLVADGSQQKVRQTAHLASNYDLAVPWWDCSRSCLSLTEGQQMKVCTTRWLIKCNKPGVESKIRNLDFTQCASAGQSGAPLMKWNDFVKLYDGHTFHKL